MISKRLRLFSLAAALGVLPLPAFAWELVYTPVNPNFGGNPMNGSFLLGTAQAQDKHKEPDSDSEDSPLQDFNKQLQRALLNKLVSTTIANSEIVGADGKFLPGEWVFGDFSLTIVAIPGTGEILMTTTDTLTGESTQVRINQ